MNLQPPSILEIPFQLESITPVAPPSGSDGLWHQYVISQGSNMITGVRAGSRTEVGDALDQMIDRLNERRSKAYAKQLQK